METAAFAIAEVLLFVILMVPHVAELASIRPLELDRVLQLEGLHLTLQDQEQESEPPALHDVVLEIRLDEVHPQEVVVLQ